MACSLSASILVARESIASLLACLKRERNQDLSGLTLVSLLIMAHLARRSAAALHRLVYFLV